MNKDNLILYWRTGYHATACSVTRLIQNFHITTLNINPLDAGSREIIILEAQIIDQPLAILRPHPDIR